MTNMSATYNYFNSDTLLLKHLQSPLKLNIII